MKSDKLSLKDNKTNHVLDENSNNTVDENYSYIYFREQGMVGESSIKIHRKNEIEIISSNFIRSL